MAFEIRFATFIKCSHDSSIELIKVLGRGSWYNEHMTRIHGLNIHERSNSIVSVNESGWGLAS